MRLPPLACLLLVALTAQPGAGATSAPAKPDAVPRPAGAPPAAGSNAPRPARPAAPARAPSRRPSALEKDARAFVESTSALFQPVGRAASEAAWVAATDVTPEHTGARAGAEKAAAALFGSKLIIE